MKEVDTMKKRYVVLDWYEDLYDPYYIGEYDTMEEAETAADKFEEDTDGECDITISDRQEIAESLEKLGF